MRGRWKAGALGVLWLTTAYPAVSEPGPAVCGDLADHLRTLNTTADPRNWPGMEHEVKVTRPMGATDAGLGGSAGAFIQPILQRQKARILAEVARDDKAPTDLWAAWLASDGADVKSLEDGDVATDYRLMSAGIGRLDQIGGGTLECNNIAYYLIDAEGQVHPLPVGRTPRKHGDPTICEHFEELSLVRFEGQALSILKTGTSAGDGDELDLWIWNGTRFSPACTLERDFAYWFRPIAVRAGSSLATPENAFLAANANRWAQAYRAHQDTLVAEYAAYVRSHVGPFVTPASDKAHDAAVKAIDARRDINDQAYKQKLIDDFIKAHPDQAATVHILQVPGNLAYSAGDVVLRPVYHNGRIYMVAVYEPANGDGFFPDIMVEMYALQDGKTVKVGAVEAERHNAGLTGVEVFPLSETAGD